MIDSLYFSVITLTTAGYGDLSPCHAVEARIERQERRNTDGDEPRQT